MKEVAISELKAKRLALLEQVRLTKKPFASHASASLWLKSCHRHPTPGKKLDRLYEGYEHRR
jgi:hypothetical protein